MQNLLPRYCNAREGRRLHTLCSYLRDSSASVKSKVHANRLQYPRHTVTACNSGARWRTASQTWSFGNKYPCALNVAVSISGATDLYAMATGTNGTNPPTTPEQRPNRLANEKSPYLLQHALNPVDWYPWGEEAFQKARSENKPIFLSVGYSTCHWCHVMERESFEDENIGRILKDGFVSIKVDREERPDVDRVYMTFIQATQGGGGWPMSVFLTPELKPFIGGTYFPPRDSYGRPGFATVLKSIAEQWKSNHERISAQGTKVMDILSKAVLVSPSEDGLPGTGCIQRGYETLEKKFDAEYGGFGGAPKFPQPVILNFLLRVYARYIGSAMGDRALETSLVTLRAMARGGMHDHVGQGFHRYSTDKFWHVPHFEKMLYDQGQLATVYLDAYQITKEEFFAEVVRDILLYVSRDLSDPDGGFYSAEDADSYPKVGSTHKKEGAFCVWTQEEVSSLLSQPLPGDESKTRADLFSHYYGVEPHGNVAPQQDPHEELKNKNVLIVRHSLEEAAEKFSMDAAQVKQLLAECREQLYQERQKRPKPHRDDKILTAWNGLMISAFSQAAQVLEDPAYLERAERAAGFIRSRLCKPDTGVLIRNGYRSETGELGIGSIEGFADDYSFLIRGLLDLFEAGQDPRWLEWAHQLQETQIKLFWDAEGGGFFSSTLGDSSILLRMKDDQDGAEPSSNSVAASNLLCLSNLLELQYQPGASEVFATFRSSLIEHPVALPQMLSAFMESSQTPKQIIIAGEKDAEDTRALLRCVHSFFLPYKVLVSHEPGKETFLGKHLKVLSTVKKLDDKATAYVCENYTCSAPVNDVEKLRKMLNPRKHLSV